MKAREVAVYRSQRVTDLYVYMDANASLETLPEPLRVRFHKAVLAMTLTLKPGQRLARTSAAEVLRQIESVGFYLQLPPEPAPYLLRGEWP